MRAAEVLKRLKKAMRLIAVFPEDTEILTVMFDGVRSGTANDMSYIQLRTGEWDKLIAADVIGDKPLLPHDGEYDKLSILTGGYELFELIEKAAPGAATSEDGKAES